jgi:quinol monooxygenase YgiN
MNHEQIAASVRIAVKPERSDDVIDLLTRMGEIAVGDEGTEIWAVHRGRKGSGEFFLYELYRDRAGGVFARERGDLYSSII